MLYIHWTKSILTDLAHFSKPEYLHLWKAASALAASALSAFSPGNLTRGEERSLIPPFPPPLPPPRAPACAWACGDWPPDDTATPRNRRAAPQNGSSAPGHGGASCHPGGTGSEHPWGPGATPSIPGDRRPPRASLGTGDHPEHPWGAGTLPLLSRCY